METSSRHRLHLLAEVRGTEVVLQFEHVARKIIHIAGEGPPQGIIPTATLLEHTLLTQGFMSTSKAVSLVAGDCKIVILRG